MLKNTKRDIIDISGLVDGGPEEAFLLFSPATIEAADKMPDAARAEIGLLIKTLADIIVTARGDAPMLRVDVCKSELSVRGDRLYECASSMVGISAGIAVRPHGVDALFAGILDLCRFAAREADTDNEKMDVFVAFLGGNRDLSKLLESDLEKAFPPG